MPRLGGTIPCTAVPQWMLVSVCVLSIAAVTAAVAVGQCDEAVFHIMPYRRFLIEDQNLLGWTVIDIALR